MNKIILIFSLVVLVFSCQIPTDPVTDQTVRLIKSSRYTFHIVSNTPRLNGYSTYSYDENNRRIRKEGFQILTRDSVLRDVFHSYTIYKHDSNNNLIRGEKFTTNGQLLLSYGDYTYDADNNLVRYNVFEFAGLGEGDYVFSNINRSYYYTYEYDANNNRIKASSFSSNDQFKGHREFIYDADNKPIRQNSYDANRVLGGPFSTYVRSNLTITENFYYYEGSRLYQQDVYEFEEF